MRTSRILRIAVFVLAVGILAACGGSSGGDTVTDTGTGTDTDTGGDTATYIIGGFVYGLDNGSVTLRNNGVDEIVVTASDFTFPTPVSGAFDVSVVETSPNITCVVYGGSGIATADVDNVSVRCGASSYALTGTVSGMEEGDAVQIRLQDAGTTTIDANGPFTLPYELVYGASYHANLRSHPVGKACLVDNATGAVNGSNDPITITCEPTFVHLSVSGDFALGILPDGTLWAWGQNGNGQLGLGDTVDRSVPTMVGVSSGESDAPSRIVSSISGVTDWQTVAAGEAHSLAIKTDGTLWAWGYNYFGQLGTGDKTTRSSPVNIDANTDWSMIAAGSGSSFARRGNELYAWGDNYYGQLGDNSTTERITPTLVPGIVSRNICTRGGTTLAVDGFEHLAGWGENAYGQIGIGDTVDRLVPTVADDTMNWQAVACGVDSSAGIAGNRLYTWGENSYGQLGDNSTIDSHEPISLFPDVSWVSVAMGRYHGAGTDNYGRLWTWGNNDFGQLGDNTTTDRLAPTRVGGVYDAWLAVYAGREHTIARRGDGTYWAWGRNGYGQLGDNSTTDRHKPVMIWPR